MKTSTNLLLLLSLFASSAAANEQPSLLRRRELESKDDDFGLEPDGIPPIQMRIVGGSTTDADDYEYHVNLQGCGATLIAADVLLTAAHCQYLNNRGALIGGDTYITGEPRAIERGSAVPHPNYRPRSQDNDLMLLKLTSPSAKTPVRLNDDTDNPSGEETLTVLGFGATKEGGSGSFSLRKVDVNHVEHASCNLSYFGRVNRDSMFCAGWEDGGRDSCQGDSGGPIIDQNGVLVGVTSWGNGCGRRNSPGVYARVSNALTWIQQETCRMSDKPPEWCEGMEIPDIPEPDNSNSNSGGGVSFFDWLSSFFGL